VKISKIVIHCSDSPDTVDIGVIEIRRWHIQDRGFRDIGYHYVVRRSGVVEVGRYENGDSILEGKEIGAHVAGKNADSLGICWVGRDHITSEQKAALLRLVANLMRTHGVSANRVFGHCELDPRKTCPRLPMDAIRKTLALL
jgi:N-acetylmuramoyl-L-alanine amidase